MESDRLIVEIDRETGWLARLVDKRTGADLAGIGVCHAQVSADASDTWGHGVTSYAAGGEPMRVTSVRLVAAGPVRSVVRVERSSGRSRLTEDIILGRDADAVEVRADLDWRERLRLLKLRFPVALAGPRATHEVPYGAVARPVDGSEEPMLTWVDVSGTADAGRPAGLALIVAAKHGTDVLPGGPAGESPSIGLTTVRSPAYAWHEPAELRPGADYAYQDQGRQRFRYLLVPHAGDWREAALARRSAELLCAPRVMLEGSHGGDLPARWSFLRCDSAAVEVTAVKGSEDAPAAGGADLVIRAVETFGRHSRARFDVPLLGREIVADFAPYQIRTFRVPAGGGQVEEVDLVEWRTGELPGRAVYLSVRAASSSAFLRTAHESRMCARMRSPASCERRAAISACTCACSACEAWICSSVEATLSGWSAFQPCTFLTNCLPYWLSAARRMMSWNSWSRFRYAGWSSMASASRRSAPPSAAMSASLIRSAASLVSSASIAARTSTRWPSTAGVRSLRTWVSMMSGSSRFHRSASLTMVPRPCWTSMRPFSSSTRRASLITVRLTP
jgi:hypothetical protein